MPKLGHLVWNDDTMKYMDEEERDTN